MLPGSAAPEVSAGQEGLLVGSAGHRGGSGSLDPAHSTAGLFYRDREC